MKDFECAIFDLDGTILDSTDVWHQVDRDFFAKRGLDLPPDYADTIASMGYDKAAEYTIKRFNLNQTVKQVLDEWNEMSLEKFEREIALKAGALEYLNFLKQKNIKLCVATASQKELFVPALKRNKIFDLFDHITTLKEVNRGKGFPDIYLKAAQKAKSEIKDCVVFEDIFAGIKGAKDGGFFTVAVYDKNSHHDIDRIKNLSDKLIYDFSELIN